MPNDPRVVERGVPEAADATLRDNLQWYLTDNIWWIIFDKQYSMDDFWKSRDKKDRQYLTDNIRKIIFHRYYFKETLWDSIRLKFIDSKDRLY